VPGQLWYYNTTREQGMQGAELELRIEFLEKNHSAQFIDKDYL
jgi:hypothetical protein